MNVRLESRARQGMIIFVPPRATLLMKLGYRRSMTALLNISRNVGCVALTENSDEAEGIEVNSTEIFGHLGHSQVRVVSGKVCFQETSRRSSKFG